MKVKCNYCGKEIEDTDLVCPYCGAPNDNAQRDASSEPQTIEELKQWYINHNLPPEEVTRYFIGKDVKEKRAIGIYLDEDSGDFIVYKNKDNGQRAVRYQGKDEKYAVNEIYQKLKEEVSNQKSNSKVPPKMPKSDKAFSWIAVLVVIGIIAAAAYLFFSVMSSPDYGYYSYNGSDYYYGSNGWYIYDSDNDDWDSVDEDDVDFIDDWDDYLTSSDYDSDSSSSSSSDDDSDWDDDWDNDSSWSSSDSWDSSSSDWDSDW